MLFIDVEFHADKIDYLINLAVDGYVYGLLLAKERNINVTDIVIRLYNIYIIILLEVLEDGFVIRNELPDTFRGVVIDIYSFLRVTRANLLIKLIIDFLTRLKFSNVFTGRGVRKNAIEFLGVVSGASFHPIASKELFYILIVDVSAALIDSLKLYYLSLTRGL